MFHFLTSCILVACANYITIGVNITPNQHLHCNYRTMLTHMIMSNVHIFITHYI